MTKKQYIECEYCGEHNDQENVICRHCQEKLAQDYVDRCPKCGILMSPGKQYCLLCSMLNAKSGLVGCAYGISIILFIVGIIIIFFRFRIGIILSAGGVLLFFSDIIVVKLRFNKIQKRYSIKRKIPL